MDNSTIIFVATLAIVLVILRWFITPIPQSVPDEFNIPDPARSSVASGTGRHRRQVTESMIEVVQAIGPQLSISQIRHSLENTGSVEATIEILMESGNLPFPPGENFDTSTSATSDHSDVQTRCTKSLLEKYEVEGEPRKSFATAGKWGKDENERLSLLRSRKAELILRARENMKATICKEE
ncbi:hypothetical protein METBIDRAFT_30302 [Metschnikowia bicuspidata var. bicuspidata NRRL YB-4993]|uniref:CUE domain-containing protein n=1 Tax=Metschnikowia bicuspidata var. bicuspidata NRRL YB-4993 TaxID=869754 RepID=A0A1A0HIE9_9ASCO|nr:hypothetical protein METBIDRAFT_30302 [Metschnikowia bicuspidata var. bicuspidata NRRL YB-4993]OBA23944.1 hypothetical protein METBIDRAFT_30302 [Metschnikowia bicuspidata var. bicuspidata NRRL YB-4993]